MEERKRRTSRLLVIDEQQRVLLVQYEDDRGEWWATPGGGAEEAESLEEAAAREAREELGLNPTSVEPLWCSFNEFVSRGIRYRQTEQFFLIHADEREVVIGSAYSGEVGHLFRWKWARREEPAAGVRTS